MKVLYLRNVPDEVAADLSDLAERAGMSLSAFAVQELTEVAARAQNRRLVADLPSVDLSVDDVVAAVEEGRAGR